MRCFYSQTIFLPKITALNSFKKRVVTNRLTKSIEQSFLGERIGFHLVKKSLLFYAKRRIIAGLYNSSPFASIFSHISPIHKTLSYFFKIHAYVTFVFFISLLIVSQHVSCNHVPIIRSWRLRDVIASCWYVPWLQEGGQVRLVGSASNGCRKVVKSGW